MPSSLNVALGFLLPFLTQAKRMLQAEPYMSDRLKDLADSSFDNPGLCCACSNSEDSIPTPANAPFCVGYNTHDRCQQWGDSCTEFAAGCTGVDGWNPDCTQGYFLHEVLGRQCNEFTVHRADADEVRGAYPRMADGICPENFDNGSVIRKQAPFTIGDNLLQVQRRTIMDNGREYIHTISDDKEQCTVYGVYTRDIGFVVQLLKTDDNPVSMGKCPLPEYSELVERELGHKIGKYSTVMRVWEKKEDPLPPPPNRLTSLAEDEGDPLPDNPETQDSGQSSKVALSSKGRAKIRNYDLNSGEEGKPAKGKIPKGGKKKKKMTEGQSSKPDFSNVDWRSKIAVPLKGPLKGEEGKKKKKKRGGPKFSKKRMNELSQPKPRP